MKQSSLAYVPYLFFRILSKSPKITCKRHCISSPIIYDYRNVTVRYSDSYAVTLIHY
jgi:hypothetical protein